LTDVVGLVASMNARDTGFVSLTIVSISYSFLLELVLLSLNVGIFVDVQSVGTMQ